jgi:hypothetical protein
MGGVEVRVTDARRVLGWRALAALPAGLADAGPAAGGAAGRTPAPRAWGASLLFAVPLTLVYAVATGFSAYYVCRAYPLAQRHPGAIVGIVADGAACAARCGARSARPGTAAGCWPPAAVFPGRAARWRDVRLGVLLYGLAAVVNYLLIEFERVRQLETRELEMMLAAQDAELRMLRTQVDPHFLFNSLNSISALTCDRPRRRARDDLQLADFFRLSLGCMRDRRSRWTRSWRWCDTSWRSSRCASASACASRPRSRAGAGACLLPPMLLQPLVENAVKHGIGQLLDPGTIRIERRARRLAAAHPGRERRRSGRRAGAHARRRTGPGERAPAPGRGLRADQASCTGAARGSLPRGAGAAGDRKGR